MASLGQVGHLRLVNTTSLKIQIVFFPWVRHTQGNVGTKELSDGPRSSNSYPLGTLTILPNRLLCLSLPPHSFCIFTLTWKELFICMNFKNFSNQKMIQYDDYILQMCVFRHNLERMKLHNSTEGEWVGSYTGLG